MTRILVIYYSAYGHAEKMAEAVAVGAAGTGVNVDVRRVPETVPDDVAQAAHFKTSQSAPIASVDELEGYDAIIVGTGTRYGRMASQMASFWDQTGGLWVKGALVGKGGAAFTSTASQHGGQETTLFSMLTNLLHHGMVIVGLPYAFQGQLRLDEVTGGTPYGASTVTGPDGARQPSLNELDGARFLGRHVADIATKLAAQR
jgi:NAD(P)H dehydrogenase (quinone)